MQQYSEVVQDANGKAQTGVEVSVLLNGQLATIYAADGITPADNPLTTDAHGGFTFKAADGTYTLTALGTSKSVILFDSAKLAKTGWIGSVASGIFSYLENNATLQAPAPAVGIGHFSAARTSATGTQELAIGMAGFAYNDKTSSPYGSAWALYGTAVQVAGSLGQTHAMELDIANWGTNAPLYPAAMFPNGATHGIWVGSGGESTNTPGLVGTASVAVGILSNDAAGIANFDKGIVFHNKAIAGADGTGSMGCAIAFAAGHQQIWFNNTNQATGEIVSTNTTQANAIRLDFSQFGAMFEDRASGNPLMQVANVASPYNWLTVTAAQNSAHPKLSVAGSYGTNVNLQYETKGTGVHDFRNVTVSASVGSLAAYAVIAINGTSFKVPIYNM